MNPTSIQGLIKSSLCSNSSVFFHNKRGYRTETISGSDLYKKISALRVILAKRGIKKGEKIIIVGHSSVEWVAVYFSCILSGFVVVPLDIMTDKKLFQKIQDQVKPKAVFQNSAINLTVNKKVNNFNLKNLDAIIKDVAPEDMHIEDVDPEDILEIQYTSGTTGEPKGVILTHKNISSAVNTAVSAVNLKFHLRFLNILPLSHVFSQIMGIFLPLHFGFEVFFLDTVQPRKIISFIRIKRIHGAIFVPGVLAALKKDLEGKCVHCSLGIQFRLIGVGGASLDKELEKWWKRKMIFVLQGYGLTETSSVVAVNKPFKSKTGSAGKIVDDIEVKINDDGEILVKGDNVTIGYYQNEIKTKESFENGWFKTGDIGYIKNRYLYIKERKKDIIVTPSGLKAYPVDIESILNSIKGVRESCVIEKDKKIHVVMILNENSNAAEIIRNANNRLMSHQKISTYTVWPENEFPKTPIGKVRKFILLQTINDIDALASRKIIYEDNLLNAIHHVLKPNKKITKSSRLVDLGMDSLKRVELISELENVFEVEIDEVQINQSTTPSDLARILKEKRAERVKFRFWPMNSIVRAFSSIYKKLLLYPLIRIFTNTEYLGVENLDFIKEPVIFVSNHQSALDVPLITKKIESKVAVAADAEVVFGIGTKKFAEKILRKILGCYSAFAYNAYPFGATIGTDASLEFTGEILDRNYS